MKSGREHRVPLSARALEIVADLDGLDPVWLFPGQRRGRPLSNMAMLVLLRDMDVATTVHGFRSTFRDWAGDRTGYQREIIEAALAHAIGDRVEAAYRRSDALAKRRDLMAAWARFCDGSRPPHFAALISPVRHFRRTTAASTGSSSAISSG